MAASFSGKRFPFLIILLVSFVHVIRANRAGSLHFSKIPREIKHTAATSVTTAQTTKEQPSFYFNDANDQHGLYGPPPPPTHTPPPPPPRTHTPPTQQFPRNYNPFRYVTNKEDQNVYNTEIIQSEKKDTTKDFDPTDLLEEEDEPPAPPTPHNPYKNNEYKTNAPPRLGNNYNPFHEDTTTIDDPNDFPEDEDDEAVARQPPPPPPKRYLPARAYNQYKHKQQGMSDTGFLENGKYAYSLDEQKFTSAEHPLNKLNNQDTTTYYQKYNDQLEDVDIQDVDDDEEGHH